MFLKKPIVRVILTIFILSVFLWLTKGLIANLLVPDPAPVIEAYLADGGSYTDRNGKLLRTVFNSREDYLYAVPLKEQSKELINAVITAEDRNFRSHPGFDFPAIIRAAWQNLTNRRIISGASTITQQLIRICHPAPRTYSAKIFEILSAIRLEQKYSKDEILEKYLNSVCLFGNVRGTAMASLLLFGKNPSMLNLAESATLAAAIQAPGRYNPFTKKGNKELLARRTRLLKEMLKYGLCSKKEYENAVNIPIPTYKKKRPFNAPHFCDYLIQSFGKPIGTIKTTIDLEIQNKLAIILKSHLPRIMKNGATQISAIIADANTLEILAMCGSVEYGPISNGFNNATISHRSGGSILKPFLYALAFEKGFYPSYIISDTMQAFKTLKGEYLPANAAKNDFGPVTIRTALGNSLNISAIKMLNMLGLDDFYSMLVELEILKYKQNAAKEFGLGLAIGNPEIRMIDLVKAYGIFSNKGCIKNIKFFINDKSESKQFISKESAGMIFNILSDETARLFTFGNPNYFKTKIPTAIKTGTSTSYRDSWLVANNGNYIIAIWVGNFNGSPTRKLSGSTACGPIFKDISEIKFPKSFYIPKIDMGKTKQFEICSISGMKPSSKCPAKGKEFFKTDIYESIPLCTFHKADNFKHELTADYASWLNTRSMYLDADPYKLQKTNQVKAENKNDKVVCKIISPHNGDTFVYSSFYENEIKLRAIPSQTVSEITWFIDGIEYEKTPPPYETIWVTEKGEHTITALIDDGIADSISIKVK